MKEAGGESRTDAGLGGGPGLCWGLSSRRPPASPTSTGAFPVAHLSPYCPRAPACPAGHPLPQGLARAPAAEAGGHAGSGTCPGGCRAEPVAAWQVLGPLPGPGPPLGPQGCPIVFGARGPQAGSSGSSPCSGNVLQSVEEGVPQPPPVPLGGEGWCWPAGGSELPRGHHAGRRKALPALGP